MIAIKTKVWNYTTTTTTPTKITTTTTYPLMGVKKIYK
jgi:hypothetical protein